jgi:hypothetical protein
VVAGGLPVHLGAPVRIPLDSAPAPHTAGSPATESLARVVRDHPVPRPIGENHARLLGSRLRPHGSSSPRLPIAGLMCLQTAKRGRKRRRVAALGPAAGSRASRGPHESPGSSYPLNDVVLMV